MADESPLSNKIQPGQVVSKTLPNGSKVYKQYAGNGEWKDIPAPQGRAIGSPVRAITPQDAAALETRRTGAAAARELNVGNQRAIPASNRLNAGPWRGWFLDAAIPNPDNKGGAFDSAGALVLGTLGKLTGAISAQDVKDYQTVKQAENASVLAKQLPQKGAQTRDDAARMAMTGVRVSNAPSQNRAVARQDAEAAAYNNAQLAFETQWTNKYGRSGLNEAGEDMSSAFRKQYSPVKPNASGVVIRRIN